MRVIVTMPYVLLFFRAVMRFMLIVLQSLSFVLNYKLKICGLNVVDKRTCSRKTGLRVILNLTLLATSILP